MKPLDPRPSSLDPEAELQEHYSLLSSAIMLVFLAVFWVQDRFMKNTKPQTPNTKKI